jgi:hypothetical protein
VLVLVLVPVPMPLAAYCAWQDLVQYCALCALQVWSMVGEAIDLFGDAQPGSGARFDLILAINVTHISPPTATEGVFAGAKNAFLGAIFTYMIIAPRQARDERRKS